ncbi:MAG: hypothetical protein JSW54_06320 [Fidelibacterota bacterium]|nr:MAG: hypothetical protein JSW54_06320 [Candidatus Neomarinimicrobiota bacterium]
MLAIAISAHEIRYIIWERSGEELQLVGCQVIPWEHELNPFRDVARIRDMIQRIVAEAGVNKTGPVYVTLDASFCHFSLAEVDPTWNAEEQLEFISLCRFGGESLYTSFQYPLADTSGLFLNIDCPSLMRRAIQTVLPANSSYSHSLSVGVFSAYSYAKRVVPALERGHRLFWRASEHGPDQFLEILDGEFIALHFFNRTVSKIRPLATVGNSRLQEPIVDFIEQLSDGQDAMFPEVDSVFSYLGSGGIGFLEQILETEQSTLSLLNPFWRWNWPEVPEADNRFTQSAFSELADAVWAAQHV